MLITGLLQTVRTHGVPQLKVRQILLYAVRAQQTFRFQVRHSHGRLLLPAVADDMGVTAVTIGSSPVQIITAGKGYNLTATAKNFGTNTQNVVPVYYTVNGGSPIGPVNTVGPIATNATENVLFSGGFAFTANTGVMSEAYTALAGDGNAVNDTFTVNVNVSENSPHSRTSKLSLIRLTGQ